MESERSLLEARSKGRLSFFFGCCSKATTLHWPPPPRLPSSSGGRPARKEHRPLLFLDHPSSGRAFSASLSFLSPRRGLRSHLLRTGEVCAGHAAREKEEPPGPFRNCESKERDLNDDGAVDRRKSPFPLSFSPFRPSFSHLLLTFYRASPSLLSGKREKCASRAIHQNRERGDGCSAEDARRQRRCCRRQRSAIEISTRPPCFCLEVQKEERRRRRRCCCSSSPRLLRQRHLAKAEEEPAASVAEEPEEKGPAPSQQRPSPRRNSSASTASAPSPSSPLLLRRRRGPHGPPAAPPRRRQAPRVLVL